MKILYYLVYTQAFAADPILGPNFENIVTTRPGAESFFLNLQGMISSIANWLLGLIAVLCVLMIVIGGYQYMFGALEGKEDGKQTVTYALTGLVVSLFASVMVSTVMGVLDVKPPIVPAAPPVTAPAPVKAPSATAIPTVPSGSGVSMSNIQNLFQKNGIVPKDSSVKIDFVDPVFAKSFVDLKNAACGDGSCKTLQTTAGTDSHEDKPNSKHRIENGATALDISINNGDGLKFFKNAQNMDGNTKGTNSKGEPYVKTSSGQKCTYETTAKVPHIHCEQSS